MPLALIAIGVLLLVSALRGTHKQLGTQLQQDFTGGGNFIYWIIALAVVGLIGYIPKFDKFSKAMIGLLIVVMFLSNRGFFAQFNQAIGQGSGTAPANTKETNNIPPFGDTGGNSSGGIANTVFTNANGLLHSIDLGGF